jgi:hypothetical protein
MSETLPDGVIQSNGRALCPHCREQLAPAARVCAHCRCDATLDVLLADPVLDPRQRYHLSRALVALSPKPRLGDWAHRLERGGVMLKGVTADRAESLMPPPAWHPTDGFTAMLADVERENERLLEESKRLPMRVVKAVWMGRNQIVAAVVTMSELEPTSALDFRLEQQGRTVCSVFASASWLQNSPGRGLAKRTSEWMKRMGMGKVYGGAAALDVESCQFQKDIPIQLILRQGDEKLNRVML